MATAMINRGVTEARRKNPGSEVKLQGKQKVLWVLSVWTLCFGYAVVRYNIFNGVEWIHLPLYIVNKSFALAGVSFVAVSYLVGKAFAVYPASAKKRRALAKFFGLTGFTFISMHAFMGMLMLSPAYFEKFFHESGRLNLPGELALVFGVLGLACLAIPAIATLPYMYDALGGELWQRAQRMGYLALLLGCGHTLAMGIGGWSDLSTWPGSLPPITLLGFLIALWALVAKLIYSLTTKKASRATNDIV